MPQAATIMLYSFAELSPSAKETAKQWWIEAMDSSDYESTIDDFVEVAKLMGVLVDYKPAMTMGGTSRNFPCVYWSLGYCQSDFASFEAIYTHRKGAKKAVREYAPKDEKLHAIVDSLVEVQRANGYNLRAVIRDRRDSVSTEVFDIRDEYREIRDGAEKAISEAIRALARWLYERIRDEHEYLTSDEQIAEAMNANEYTFRENGRREDA